MRTDKFPLGKLIFAEGDSGEEAYRILEGTVEISIQDEGQKLVLATLGQGEIFGEMAMIECRPRSASARVLEPTLVEVIRREDFERILTEGGERMLPYLSTIFERLRVTNDRLLTALDKLDQLQSTRELRQREVFNSQAHSIRVQLDPDTDELRRHTALLGCVVKHYPFQLGRRGEFIGGEAVLQNQLLIPDSAPFRVSRKHCILDTGADGVFVEDKTSKLGSIVNGIRIGGASRETRVRLSNGVNTLVLGSADSQVRFKLTLLDENQAGAPQS